MQRCFFIAFLGWLFIATELAAEEQGLDLQRFAYIGDLQRLEQTLDSGVDLEATGKHGMTALLWAAYNNSTRAVERLLNAGANPNATTPSNFTALTYAARHQNIEMLEALLAANARPRQDSQGKDPLYEAVRIGNLAITRKLLPFQANLDHPYQNPDAPRSLRTTLLLTALNSGNAELAHYLIDQGASIHRPNERGETPLLAALRTGQPKLAELLLAQGADIGAVDEMGFSALNHAIHNSNSSLITRILASGAADFDRRFSSRVANDKPPLAEHQIYYRQHSDKLYGYLHQAALLGNTSALKALLEAGMKIDQLTAAEDLQLDALALAARAGHLETARLLVEQGANPYRIYRNQRPQGSLGIYYAAGGHRQYSLLELVVFAEEHHPEVVQYLFELPDSQRYLHIADPAFYRNLLMLAAHETSEGETDGHYQKVLQQWDSRGYALADTIREETAEQLTRLHSPEPETGEPQTLASQIREAIRQGDLQTLDELQAEDIDLLEELPGALYRASFAEQPQLVMPLVNWGADPTLRLGNMEKPPLASYARKMAKDPRWQAVVLELLEAGFDPNPKDRQGSTPLLAYLLNDGQDEQLISQLLDQGAHLGDPNTAIFRLWQMKKQEALLQHPTSRALLEKNLEASDLDAVLERLMQARSHLRRYRDSYRPGLEWLLDYSYHQQRPLNQAALLETAEALNDRWMHLMLRFYQL